MSKTTISHSVVGLLVLVALSGTVWSAVAQAGPVPTPQASATRIEGQLDDLHGIGAPEERWFDAAGNAHVRGQYGTLLWSGDFQCREYWLANWNRNDQSGTFAERGTSSFTGLLFGEPVVWEATYTYDCTDWFGTRACKVNYNGHLEDGRVFNAKGNWVRGEPKLVTGRIVGRRR